MREYILSELWKINSFSYIKMLQNNHQDLTFYIFGGAIRDLAHNYYHKDQVVIRDIDVLVDNKNNPNFDLKTLNPQSSLDKLDFFATSNNFLFIKDHKKITEFSLNTDYTINSCYFNMRDAEITHHDLFEDHISNRVISLLIDGNSCKDNIRGNWRTFVKYNIMKQKLNYQADDKTLIEFKKIKDVLMLDVMHNKMIKYCKENKLEKYLDGLFNELYSY